MPQAAYYRLDHSYMSRKTSGPTHLRAHANYCANTNKCSRVVAVNLSTNRREIDRQLAAHDGTITRANGRIAEKIQICHPVGMSLEHRYQATRRFLWRVTFQGQIKAVAFHHDQDGHNPHAHCIIIDAGDDGRPVGHFGRSGTYRREHSPVKGNPTEWLRRVWEEECNGVLEEYGYDQRIDRRTNLERGLQEAQKHRGYDNDNSPANDAESLAPTELEREDTPAPEPLESEASLPPDAPSSQFEERDDEPIPSEDETEDAYEGDEGMAVSKKLEYAARELKELGIMRGKRKEVARLRNEYAYWKGEAETARAKAEIAKNAQVDAITRTERAVEGHKQTHFMGFRRGINVKLGFLHIKTAGIDKAIQAEAEWQKAMYAESLRNADLREAETYANRATQKVWEFEQRVASLEQHIGMHERINGEENDFDAAEVYFKEALGQHLKGVSPNDIIDAYEADALGLDEAKEMLIHMGHTDLANWIEAQEEDQAPSH